MFLFCPSIFLDRSGKTTFLNALTGGLDSSVSSSGDLHSSDGDQLISEKIAFIYQEDSFFSQLTVRETLQLAASLRLYDSVSQTLISEIIQYLALTHVADSLVGDIISRGISGGERKRLAVGCEMLGTAPSLLVADEPSSGLDSFQAKQVVLLLRKIAIEKNIAVVCAIHQPRSSIWSIFDDILLLGPGGVVIYHGSRDQALAYFASIGHHCPPDTNPAEFLIDLVSFDQQSPEASSQRIKSLSEAFSASKSYAVPLVGPVTHLPILKIIPILPTTLWWGPRRAVFRFLILLKRALRQTLRDNATNLTRLAVSSVLAALLGGMYGGKDNISGALDSNTVANRVNLIAHASINVGMLSMVKALQLFKRERAVVDRERSLGRYSAVEYLAAKLCAELPFDAIVGAVSRQLHQWT